MKYFPARVAWLPALPVRLAARFSWLIGNRLLTSDRLPFSQLRLEPAHRGDPSAERSPPVIAGSVCRNVKLVGMADSCRDSWGRHEFRRRESSMW